MMKNGQGIYLKKKAPRREVEIPTDFFRYILFSRARIGAEADVSSNVERMKRWLEIKDENEQLGHTVAWRMRHLVEAKIHATMEENRTLKNEMEGLKELKKVCEGLNINPLWLHDIEFKVRERLMEFKSGFNHDFFKELGHTIGYIDRLKDMLEVVREKLEIKNHE